MKNSTEGIISKDKFIDKLSNACALNVMLDSHAECISVIKKEIQNIEKVSVAILKKLKSSEKARLIYIGAGTSGRIAVQDAVELYPTFGWPKNE